MKRKTKKKFQNPLKKPAHPTLKKCKDRAWKAFSIYIRTRDGFECMPAREYATPCGGPIQAGHCIDKGQGAALHFDEEDVFGQCRNHNGEHRYKKQFYHNWFIKKFGQEKFDEIVQRSKKIVQMKWYEYLDIEALYLDKINLLPNEPHGTTNI